MNRRALRIMAHQARVAAGNFCVGLACGAFVVAALCAILTMLYAPLETIGAWLSGDPLRLAPVVYIGWVIWACIAVLFVLFWYDDACEAANKQNWLDHVVGPRDEEDDK